MKNGNKKSIIYYIELLINGKFIPRNHKKAAKLIEMRLKDDKSMYYLLCEKIAKKENLYEEAKSNLEESIKLGKNESMYELGKVYYKGIGTSMDQAKEIEYFKKSCENNYPKAMYKYRLILKESKYGIGYIVQAASKGYSKAMYYYS